MFLVDVLLLEKKIAKISSHQKFQKSWTAKIFHYLLKKKILPRGKMKLQNKTLPQSNQAVGELSRLWLMIDGWINFSRRKGKRIVSIQINSVIFSFIHFDANMCSFFFLTWCTFFFHLLRWTPQWGKFWKCSKSITIIIYLLNLIINLRIFNILLHNI